MIFNIFSYHIFITEFFEKVVVFPEGLIHYQQNLDCQPARYISALNSEDPGVLTVSNRLFTFPLEALTATFDLSPYIVQHIKRNLPENIAAGRKECLIRCKMPTGD